MSLFAKHAKPEGPNSRAISASSLFGDEWGAESESGERVSPRTAMQLAAVWRCVTLVAELLSSLPVDTFQGSGSSKTEVVAAPPVALRPSLRVTRREWVYQYVVSMMLRGQAIGVVVEFDRAGRPQTVEWVDPSSVASTCESSLALPEYYINGMHVPRDHIVHVRNVLMPGCIEGLSPIEHHAETIGVGLAARKFGAQWFGQGAHPSAILSTDQRLDPKQADAMKKGFVAALRKRREPAVLGAGIQYTPIQVSPNESQFLETQGLNSAEIAMVFGIMPELIGAAPVGGGSSLTYANREQRWQDFIATCLAHYAVRLEDSWSAMLPDGLSQKFNLNALLRGDTLSRYQAHAIGLSSGFLELNEVRDLEDRKSLPVRQESDPEVTAALNLAEKAPSLVQNPGLPALVDQLRVLAGKEPSNPVPAPPVDNNSQGAQA